WVYEAGAWRPLGLAAWHELQHADLDDPVLPGLLAGRLQVDDCQRFPQRDVLEAGHALSPPPASSPAAANGQRNAGQVPTVRRRRSTLKVLFHNSRKS